MNFKEPKNVPKCKRCGRSNKDCCCGNKSVAPPHEDKGAEEIKYAIKEAIQVLEHYDTGEDFALVSCLRRLREIDREERNVLVRSLLDRSEAEEARAIRNRAIQECIDCFNGMFLVPPSDTVEVAKQMKESYYKMLKLKTS